MLSYGLSRWPLAFPILLGLSGCGFVGEPLPPLLNMPQPVVDLAAVQRDAQIVAHFTIPKLTTEGRVMREVHWELRAGEPGAGEFRLEEWAARAKSLGEAPAQNGVAEYKFSAQPWMGKDVVLSARLRSRAGRYSDWSKALVLSVIRAPAIPHDLHAFNVAEGVRLTWQGAGPAYRILRRAAGQPESTVAGDTTAPEFVDKLTVYGKEVRYQVEAVVKTANGEVESELSPELTFVPKDEFPPAVPSGLMSVPTTGSIELTWDRNTESDLAGYRIYRAAPGGDFEKIAENADAPSYGDRKVESGKVYRYAVSAFDKSGNESKRSEPLEVTAP